MFLTWLVFKRLTTGTDNDPSLDMPECADPDFDPSVVPPDANSMVKLYSKDMLCSDCFLKYFHSRLASPFLGEGEHTDYLLDQWTDIQSACGKNMPATTVSNTLYLGKFLPRSSSVGRLC
jgi:hypothetical protein